MAFVDASARPVSIAFRAYWGATHADDVRPPATYFVDPDGFKNGRQPIDIDTAHERFADDHPYLEQQKDGRVLLMDTCMHTGRTLLPMRDIMRAVGFADVRLGVVSNKRNSSKTKPDFVALRRKPYYLCYPFGPEALVRHSDGSLYSESALKETPGKGRHLAQINEMRQEIKRIIHEGIAG